MAVNYPSFLESEIFNRSPEESMFHIVPVPLENSVTYGKGTRNGPLAILEASMQLEVYDGFSCPCEKGICTWDAVDCSMAVEDLMSSICNTVTKILGSGRNRIPFLLGGEHSISYGAFKAVNESDIKFGIVQFDAHADLRDSYENSIWNHACVMKRALDLNIPVFQLGVRAISPEELETRKRFKPLVSYIDGYDIGVKGIPHGNIFPHSFPDNVYITIDVDGLDPSIMPSTGTPVPGGIQWFQMQELLRKIASEKKIIGADIVELAPVEGLQAHNFTAARLVYDLMGIIQRSKQQ